MTTDLITRLQRHVEQVDSLAPSLEEMLANFDAHGRVIDSTRHQRLHELPGPFAPDEVDAGLSLAASVDTVAEADANEHLGDDLMVDYLQQRPDGSEAPSKQKGWSGVVVAVAAMFLVVVGVVVVADGNSGDIATDPSSSPSVVESVAPPAVTDAVSSPTVAAPVTPSEQAEGFTDGVRVRERLASVIATGQGLVAVGYSRKGSFANPVYVRDDAAVWTSADGATWSQVPHDAAVFGQLRAQRINSVVVGGPGLVAVGRMSQSDDFGDPGQEAVVWTSVDGTTWSLVPHDEEIFGGPGNQRMRGVTAGGPGLVVVGFDGGNYGRSVDAAVWTSVDGITWSRVPHDEAVFGGTRMHSVTVGGPGLVAVGSTGLDGDNSIAIPDFERDPTYDGDAVVWTSVDGITWSRVPHDEAIFGGPNDQSMSKIIAAGPGLVAVGVELGDDGMDAAVWTSVDGITWSRVPHDEAIFGGAGSQEMFDVAAGGPGLVAVGFEGPDSVYFDDGDDSVNAAVWTSVDGIAWDRVAPDEEVFGGPGSQVMSGVTATNGTLVAVGRDGPGAWDKVGTVQAAVWTSTDGITWSRAAPDPTIDEAGS